jgi:hypothetical protein
VLDPVEQARADHEAGRQLVDHPDALAVLKAWGDEGIRAYTRERRALGPAHAPPPLPVAIFAILVGAAGDEAAVFVQDHWRKQPAVLLMLPLLAATAFGLADLREKTGRAAALRRGVGHVRDGPAVPPPGRVIAVALGIAAGNLWLRFHAGIRYPRGRGAPAALVASVVQEIRQRRLWRDHPVQRS